MFITGLSRPLMTPMITRSCITQVNSVPVPAMKPPKPASVQDTLAGLQTNIRTLAPKVQHCMSDWPGRAVMWHGYSTISAKENESIFLMGYLLRTQGWPIQIAQLSTPAWGSDAPEIRYLNNVCLVCETAPKPSENIVVDFRLPHFDQRHPRFPEDVFQRPFISTCESMPDRTLPQPIFIGKQSTLFDHIATIHDTPAEANATTHCDDLEIKGGYSLLSLNKGHIFCETSPLMANMIGVWLNQAGLLTLEPLIDKYHQNIQTEPLFHFNTAFNRFRHRVQTVVSEIKTKA